MIKIPAGTYFLGDPCYAVEDADWTPLLHSCDFFDGSAKGTLPSGEHVVAFSTAYGDGEYHSQFGDAFPVDAGLIGLVPWTGSETQVEAVKDLLGIKVTFETDTNAFSDDGVLVFGHIEIDTAG